MSFLAAAKKDIAYQKFVSRAIAIDVAATVTRDSRRSKGAASASATAI